MSNRIHALAQQLTGKALVEECGIEEVRQIAQRYPYFAPAQFLLVQKLKESGSPDLELQQRKAVLFFSDPLLFDYFISSENFYTDDVVSGSKSEWLPPNDEGGTNDTDTDEIIMESQLVEDDSYEKVVGVSEPIIEPESEKQEVEISNPYLLNHEVKDENSNDISPENEEPPVTKDAVENGTSEIILNDPLIQEEKISSHKIVQGGISHPPEEGLAFEPFHTVDYFASQGIKVSQEGQTNDRLGKQLKSFTDWLKTMKRLPAVQTTGHVEMIAEKKVENMASRSVSESSVITEAMAEVWAKQGNKEKAVETYNKLSLLNPAKKAFFAAKIENLKTT
jgi:hypothetical protein